MKIAPFKASYPKVELITSPKSFFGNIKMNYREYKDNNMYKDLEEKAYFVYKISTKYATHLGLLSMTDVKDMHTKNILKHEKTLAAKEQRMMYLLLQRKALVKPVLLGFKSNAQINKQLEKVTQVKPMLKVNFKGESEGHAIWHVSDKNTIENITALFSKVKRAYIGDGHHRSSTVKLLSETKELGEEAKKYKQLYTAYFPFKQLKICDYNRVVDICQIITIPEFIVELSKYFDISKMDSAGKPHKKHIITIYISGIWYKLKWKEKYTKNTKGNVLLDSALINKYIFENILGIKDVRVDNCINYIGGTQPLQKIESVANKLSAGIGICIYPVSVRELTSIADSGMTLPPKSTWFLPRLKSGLITNDL